MLATNEVGEIIQPGQLTRVLEWTADGNSFFLGFMGTGSYSGYFKLFVQKASPTDPAVLEPAKVYYIYQTSPSNRTAYVVDRVEKFPAGTLVELYVEHDSASAETFYGTLLGGIN
jgi:hypothetical protein